MYDVEATFVLQRPATSFLQVAYWASSWVALLGRPPECSSFPLLGVSLPMSPILSERQNPFLLRVKTSSD